jgi:hypothetical protein
MNAFVLVTGAFFSSLAFLSGKWYQALIFGYATLAACTSPAPHHYTAASSCTSTGKTVKEVCVATSAPA